MGDLNVTYVAEDSRPIHVLHGDVVMRLTIVEAQLLQVRLAARLKGITLVVGGMSDYQRRYLHALLRQHGVTGDARFPVLAKILGRPVGSTNELNPADADRCIAALQEVARA